MSRKNSREAKKARREEKALRIFNREQAAARAREDLEVSLREKIGKVIETYNEKLARSSVPELREEYKKRRAANPDLPPYSKMKKDELIANLRLGSETADAMADRRLAMR